MDIYKHEKRNLALVLSGRFESIVGAAALMVAMPLYILDLTKSGAIMGFVTVFQILPRLLVLPFGGVIGDRVNRKWWMVGLDELRGILLLLMWLILQRGFLSLPVLLIFIGILSILDGLFSAPTAAMFGDVVRKEHMKLATSLNSASHGLGNIVGPMLGGLIYGMYGFKNVILFTGVLYIFSGVTEMFIVYRFSPNSEKLKFFSEIGEGIAFVWNNRGLRFLFFFAIILNFLASPLFMVVFPYLSRIVFKFSAAQFGSLQTFATVGALLGNISIIVFLRKVSSKGLITTGLVLQSLFSIVFSFVIMPWVGLSTLNIYLMFAGALVIISFFNVLVNIPINANLQILIPSELRSRVFSVLEFLATCMIPLSSLIYGYLLDKIQPLWFFLSVNILTLFVVLIFIVNAPQEAYDPNLVTTK
ncbi:MAG: MFS transporter [Fervidobacterium sp.]|nr:MFS transporter [Fervidobacterium sp.]